MEDLVGELDGGGSADRDSARRARFRCNGKSSSIQPCGNEPSIVI